MAGDWLKIEICIHHKPEVMAMADELGIEVDEVVGRLIRVWVWFDTHTADGCNASVTQMKRMDSIAGVTGFAQAMVNQGWLVVSEHGVTMPNFGRHNGKSAKHRALTRDRVIRSRNAVRVTESLPEKRREESNYLPAAGDEKAATRSEVFKAIELAMGRGITSSEVGQIIAWVQVAEQNTYRIGGADVPGLTLALRCAQETAEKAKPHTVYAATQYAAKVMAECQRRGCWPGERPPEEPKYVKPGSPQAHAAASAKAKAAVDAQEAARAAQRATEAAKLAALESRLSQLDNLDHDTLEAIKSKAVTAAPNDFTRRAFAAADPRTNRPLRVAMLNHIEEPANA